MVCLDSITQLWRNPPNFCHVATRGKRLDGRLGWGASRGLHCAVTTKTTRTKKSEQNETISAGFMVETVIEEREKNRKKRRHEDEISGGSDVQRAKCDGGSTGRGRSHGGRRGGLIRGGLAQEYAKFFDRVESLLWSMEGMHRGTER